jgi:superfamily I DNA/RNA helicase
VPSDREPRRARRGGPCGAEGQEVPLLDEPRTVKLATVHSFKGWDINTLFLVVYSDEAFTGSEASPGVRERISDEELVYTAITRCRHNLFVANLGDRKFHDFFSRVKAGD